MTHVVNDVTEDFDGRPHSLTHPDDGEYRKLTNRLLHNKVLPEEAIAEMDRSTSEIIGKSIDLKGSQTSSSCLVVGYVQSGKTSSIIGSCACAIDQGFKILVVLTGTKLNLNDQNRSRLFDSDSGLAQSMSSLFKAVRIHNPEQQVSDCRRIIKNGKCLLITCLKNHSQMSKVAQLLSSLSNEEGDICIIDDECDSYSLNTKVRQGEYSATYRHLQEMRRAGAKANFCSYIGYTATPQANALISITDGLSPDFCVLLKPGSGYTGGDFFFGKGTDGTRRTDRYVRVIPNDDLSLSLELGKEEPPSLLRAMKSFILSVAQGFLDGLPDQNQPRSMMVHPAKEQSSHQKHYQWVFEKLKVWRGELQETGSQDYESLKLSFKEEWGLLKKRGGASIADFEILFDEVVSIVTNDQIRVALTNSDNKLPDGETWKEFFNCVPASIIIGGNNLDRGFTVEGLIVSWLAREASNVQADTMQQRARFFGYKKNYEAFCQIWMSSQMKGRFEQYVDHESFMHEWLEANKNHLKDDKVIRKFILDRSMSLTRRNVYVTELTNSGYRYSEWSQVSQLLNEDKISHEAQELHTYLSSVTADLDFVEAKDPNIYPWCGSHSRTHHAAEITVEKAVEILTDAARRLTDEESQKFLTCATVIGFLGKKDPDFDKMGASVILMDRSTESRIPKNFPTTVLKNKLTNYQFGRAGSYPGDKAVKWGGVTIQLHKFRVNDNPDPITGLCVGICDEYLPRIPGFIIQDQAN